MITNPNPVLAVYNCDTHCVPCAEARFGQSLYDRDTASRDAVGEPPTLVYDWSFEPQPQGEYCGTCHREICEPYCPHGYEIFEGEDYDLKPGWYWWSCQPGCLPDGDAHGPFETEDEALHDLLQDYPG